MKQRRNSGMFVWERLVCCAFVFWLQVVGVRTNSVLHHIIHAAPIVVLLFVPPSPTRHFTGFLAGFLWVFMLAVVSPMIYESIILGHILNPQYPYIVLAPIAAVLALCWAIVNLSLLHARNFVFIHFSLAGLALAILFAWAHPYVSFAINAPLERTLAGQYAWIVVLLLETAIVLGLPSLHAYRFLPKQRDSKRFVLLQIAYWVFFVFAMVVGLLPSVNR